MKTNNRKHRVWVIAIGPETHKRLRLMAAERSIKLNELITELINQEWLKSQMEKNHASKEKSVKAV